MWALGQAGQDSVSIFCAKIPFCGSLLYTPGLSVVPHFKILFSWFHDPSRCLTGYKVRTSYPFQSTWQCVCVCLCVCVLVCHCLSMGTCGCGQEPEGIRSHGAGITGVCELPDLDADLQTPVRMIEQQVLLTAAPSICPLPFVLRQELVGGKPPWRKWVTGDRLLCVVT